MQISNFLQITISDIFNELWKNLFLFLINSEKLIRSYQEIMIDPWLMIDFWPKNTRLVIGLLPNQTFINFTCENAYLFTRTGGHHF